MQLSATDAQSGLAFIQYTINRGPTQTLHGATATFNITADGNNSVDYSATDRAGNVNRSGLNLWIDATPPIITGHADRTGWSDRPVTIFFNCSDATSGIASCQAPISVTSEGADQAVVGTATDKAGNQASTIVSGINVDMTAPTTSITAPSTWQNEVVPVTLTATDRHSGVTATYYTVNGGALQSGTSFTIADEGTQTITFWSVDLAGNAESPRTAMIQIDKTAPTISGAADRAANAVGWYNADVTVRFTCDDALSGVATCADDTTLGEGANQNATGSVTDNAGNSSSTSVDGINVDKTAPTITGTADRFANVAGWYNTAVTIQYSCDDTLSGVATCAEAQALGEGANQSATGSATDKAGNSASTTVSGINVDMTAPTISGTADRAANAAGWYNAPVTVSFSCGDALSGVATCATPVTLGEGDNKSATGAATDNAGNSAITVVSGVRVDMTAPTTSITAPTTWQNEDVPVSLTATDSLSGVAATYYTINGGTPQSGSSFTVADEGTHTVTFWSVDAAGNAEAAQTATVQIDKTAPNINGTTDRAANAAGWYNAQVTVSFTCTDLNSGVDTCAASITLGEGANQSATGSATDKAGNTASTTVNGINVDMIAPTVSYTGNAGTYTVDQHVRITCAAADDLAGVASSTCVDVVGPASTFLLGANSFSASATDHAGNVGSSNTSFTVVVNVDSLSSLVQQFAPDELGNSLTSKLAAIGKGKGKSAENQIEAFVNQVRAQAGKKLTHEQAELLIRLVRML